MKLERVTLLNFRSHLHTVISLERVTFVRGLNRCGKTSIAYAIEMVLSGRCTVTDEGGKGFEQLIRSGEQTATVILESLTFVITLTLNRSSGRTLKVETLPSGKSSRTMMGKQAQEWIAENIGAPDVISASLDAWRFIDFSDNDQAALLARVLLPAKLELNADIGEWLSSNGLSVVERPSLFATIEATYKSIAAARTEQSRTVRDLKTLVEPPSMRGRDLASERLAVDALRGEVDTVQNRVWLLTTEIARAVASEERRDSLNLKVEEVDAQLAVLRQGVLPAEKRAALQVKAKLAAQRDTLRLKLTQERDALKGIVETLSHATDSKCPTCKGALTEESQAIIFRPFYVSKGMADATISTLERELRAAIEGESAAKDIAADDVVKKSIKESQTMRDNFKRELKEISAVATVTEEMTEALATAKTTLEELNAKMFAKQDAMVALATLEAQHTSYRAQLHRRTTAEEKIVELEKLLAYFGPTGVSAGLIAERLDLFTERVNWVLEQWGYTLTFSMQPYSLKVSELSGALLHPRQLSTSERYRLGIAIGEAITGWTGLNFMIADGADLLDKEDKWKLAQMFLQSDLEQVIVTSTGVAGTFAAPSTAFYTLSKFESVTAVEADAIHPAQMEGMAG